MDFGELKVLVVEDHDFQRRMTLRLLADLGVTDASECCNGREALDRLMRGPSPDIVLTDLDMPEMDGIELIRHVAELQLARAVVIASGLDSALLASVEEMARAYGLQVLGNVEKPLTRERIAVLLRRFSADGAATDANALAELEPGEVVRGLEVGEFTVALQPLVDFSSGRLSGCEALARWYPPPHGLAVPPLRFVRALEQAGRIPELTRHMLDTAARHGAELARAGLELKLSVNVSMLDLADVGAADRFADIVRAAGVEPRQITLEITESCVAEQLARALNVLTRLRLKGFGLAIDDYGTGYSSLQQISQIPFTELKIDQGFVRHCDTDVRRRAIVESSLDLARRLKLHTVAEGVETRGEWLLLKGSGCDRAQGWFVAPAMPADAFLNWAGNYEPPAL